MSRPAKAGAKRNQDTQPKRTAATGLWQQVARAAKQANRELSDNCDRQSKVQWAPPSKEEQDRLAVPVLKATWALIRGGWCQGAISAGKSWSVYGAIGEVGPGIAAEYARRLLRKAIGEHDLVAWNNHPIRKRGDVLRALVAAIAAGEGRAAHRGGWVVSSGVGR